jgi:xanthine dehydrogenase YagS FAD-binding subunit
MIDFQLITASTPSEASQVAATSQTAQQGADVRFVAGGTTLIDLMKLDVENPRQVVDINRLDLAKVEKQADGSVRIGALVRNSDLAHAAAITNGYPVLSEALLSGASAQLRNMATTGGNLLQRTRCPYFRDLAYSQCNKRTPGSGCAAIGGFNRIHAILGTSENCIATHASDMAVAMMALEAVIHVQGASGDRDFPIGEFYLLPGSTPQNENVLKPGDLITHVTLPAPIPGARSHYLKLRDRASYEFALASAAVIVHVEGGKIRKARVALGGVATRPWRSLEAEHALEGKPATETHFRAAAEAALRTAKPQSFNAYKVQLAKLCIVRALNVATAQA